MRNKTERFPINQMGAKYMREARERNFHPKSKAAKAKRRREYKERLL